MLLGWDINDGARIIVLATVGQHKFYTNLSNFIGIIGYWIGGFRASQSSISVLTTARLQGLGCLLSVLNTCISARASLRSMTSDPGTYHLSFHSAQLLWEHLF